MTHHIDLDAIRLEHGAHDERENGVCLLEAVAWFAGEDHGDHPACVSPVLGAFGRSWNDALDDQTRQRLRPYVPRMVGTAGDAAADERRAWMLTDWLVHECAPAWLRCAGLADEADQLAALPPVTDAPSARAAQPVLDGVRKRAEGAWAAVRAAAEATAGAAGEAAGDAAWAAAGEAAWDAARDAAWDAARDAARAAARAAAEQRLKPVVAELQESAFALLGRLCDVRTVAEAR